MIKKGWINLKEGLNFESQEFECERERSESYTFKKFCFNFEI